MAVASLVQPIGFIRQSFFLDIGPSFLRLDGKTEYQRAMYPDLMAMAAKDASSAGWVLAGSSPATFKLRKIPAGTALVASGFDTDAGRMFGAAETVLTIDMLPEHAHDYTAASSEMAQGGLLSGLVQVLRGIKLTTGTKTGVAGSKVPKAVPTQSPSISLHTFVFAGRPRQL